MYVHFVLCFVCFNLFSKLYATLIYYLNCFHIHTTQPTIFRVGCGGNPNEFVWNFRNAKGVVRHGRLSFLNLEFHTFGGTLDCIGSFGLLLQRRAQVICAFVQIRF